MTHIIGRKITAIAAGIEITGYVIDKVIVNSETWYMVVAEESDEVHMVLPRLITKIWNPPSIPSPK